MHIFVRAPPCRLVNSQEVAVDKARVGRRRGLLAMAGSLLWVATGVLFGFTGGGGTRGEAVLRTVLLNPALLFLIVGLLGFHAKQAKRSSRLGAAGFAVCLLGTGLMLLGNVTEIWVYKYLHGVLEARWTPGWRAMGVGLMLLPAGFIVLGIGTLKAGVFTGWRRAVPLAFGLMLVLVVSAFMLTYWTDLGDIISRLATALMFYGIGLGWAALGYALWSEKAAYIQMEPMCAGLDPKRT